MSKGYPLLVSLFLLSLLFLTGCLQQGAQFGAPGGSSIQGKVAVPDSDCVVCSCSNPQVSSGNEPAPEVKVSLMGENGNNLVTYTNQCGEYEVSGAQDSCYILYAKVQDNMWVKQGIIPEGSSYNAGEANAYTTAQVIIYEVAKQRFPDQVKCSDIPGFAPTAQLVQAVENALRECRDAQQDSEVINLASRLVQNLFGAPGGGGGGVIIVPGGGEETTHTLSGFVFDDLDGDGVKDTGESGLAGITVTLSGAGSRITQTVSDGSYSFSGLSNGNYTVTISGYSTPYEPTTPNPLNVSISGANLANVNFGLRESYLIEGCIWEDKDNDGERDSGETGVAGVTVYLKSNGQLVDQTITGEGGCYSFTVGPGNYVVSIVPPPGYSSDPPPDSITVTIANSNSTGNDFRLYLVTYSVGGIVFNDKNGDGKYNDGEVGIGGVKLILRKNGQEIAQTNSEPDGTYIFSGLEPASYTVYCETPNGYEPTTITTKNAKIVDKNLTRNFGFKALGFSISGKVRDKYTEAGVNGAKISLYDTSWNWIADDTSEANGSFMFEGLLPGSYFIKVNSPYPSGYGSVEPSLRTVNISSTDVGGQIFDLVPNPEETYSISGHVFKDKAGGQKNIFDSGEGVNGVTVKLNPGFKGSIEWEVVTSGDGYYEFKNLPAGEYSVEIVNPPTGFYVKSPNPSYYNITLGSNLSDKNFQLAKIEPEPIYFIKGKVLDKDNGAPIANVVVNLFDISGGTPVLLNAVLSDSDGGYEFEDLPAGAYRVKVQLPAGYIDSDPGKYEFGNLNSNQQDKNFLLTRNESYCCEYYLHQSNANWQKGSKDCKDCKGWDVHVEGLIKGANCSEKDLEVIVEIYDKGGNFKTQESLGTFSPNSAGNISFGGTVEMNLGYKPESWQYKIIISDPDGECSDIYSNLEEISGDSSGQGNGS